MEEIHLSVMVHSPQTESTMRHLLAKFEERTKIRVHLLLLDWVQARQELNRIATAQQGPDVSEVGTTWIQDLASMQSLQPFEAGNLRQLGGYEAFLETTWKTVQPTADQVPWAVPFLAETYAIHYRKDLLQRAGIDSHVAFQTHLAIEQTSQKLVLSLICLDGLRYPVK